MLDQLWNKYWVNALASSPLIATRELATGQVNDIGAPATLPRPPILPLQPAGCGCRDHLHLGDR